ncbi:MAG: hypothetical protein MRY21_07050 [Simkaniaceae bacterium]|nr:hypothetical protein [Simkaniaceae bacterium]
MEAYNANGISSNFGSNDPNINSSSVGESLLSLCSSAPYSPLNSSHNEAYFCGIFAVLRQSQNPEFKVLVESCTEDLESNNFSSFTANLGSLINATNNFSWGQVFSSSDGVKADGFDYTKNLASSLLRAVNTNIYESTFHRSEGGHAILGMQKILQTALAASPTSSNGIPAGTSTSVICPIVDSYLNDFVEVPNNPLGSNSSSFSDEVKSAVENIQNSLFLITDVTSGESDTQAINSIFTYLTVQLDASTSLTPQDKAKYVQFLVNLGNRLTGAVGVEFNKLLDKVRVPLISAEKFWSAGQEDSMDINYVSEIISNPGTISPVASALIQLFDSHAEPGDAGGNIDFFKGIFSLLSQSLSSAYQPILEQCYSDLEKGDFTTFQNDCGNLITTLVNSNASWSQILLSQNSNVNILYQVSEFLSSSLSGLSGNTEGLVGLQGIIKSILTGSGANASSFFSQTFGPYLKSFVALDPNSPDFASNISLISRDLNSLLILSNGVTNATSPTDAVKECFINAVKYLAANYSTSNSQIALTNLRVLEVFGSALSGDGKSEFDLLYDKIEQPLNNIISNYGQGTVDPVDLTFLEEVILNSKDPNNIYLSPVANALESLFLEYANSHGTSDTLNYFKGVFSILDKFPSASALVKACYSQLASGNLNGFEETFIKLEASFSSTDSWTSLINSNQQTGSSDNLLYMLSQALASAGSGLGSNATAMQGLRDIVKSIYNSIDTTQSSFFSETFGTYLNSFISLDSSSSDFLTNASVVFNDLSSLITLSNGIKNSTPPADAVKQLFYNEVNLLNISIRLAPTNALLNTLKVLTAVGSFLTGDAKSMFDTYSPIEPTMNYLMSKFENNSIDPIDVIIFSKFFFNGETPNQVCPSPLAQRFLNMFHSMPTPETEAGNISYFEGILSIFSQVGDSLRSQGMLSVCYSDLSMNNYNKFLQDFSTLLTNMPSNTSLSSVFENPKLNIYGSDNLLYFLASELGSLTYQIKLNSSFIAGLQTMLRQVYNSFISTQPPFFSQVFSSEFLAIINLNPTDPDAVENLQKIISAFGALTSILVGVNNNDSPNTCVTSMFRNWLTSVYNKCKNGATISTDLSNELNILEAMGQNLTGDYKSVYISCMDNIQNDLYSFMQATSTTDRIFYLNALYGTLKYPPFTNENT